MRFEREQEIKIDNKVVYIIDVLELNESQYLYVQEVDEDEDDLMDKYYVYKYVQSQNAMVHIKDEKELEKLLKLFADHINESL